MTDETYSVGVGGTTLRVTYGTTENASVDALKAAFKQLLADVGRVEVELVDSTVHYGRGMAVSFDIRIESNPGFDRAETVEEMSVRRRQV